MGHPGYLDQPMDSDAIQILKNYLDCGFRVEIKGAIVFEVFSDSYKVGRDSLGWNGLRVKKVFSPVSQWR